MSNLENVLFSYFNNAIRYMKAQPLNLGGYSASGGGTGGPPGGFLGMLPQGRVTYDFTEAEDNSIPASGLSLLTNLDHIRYRIATLETAISGGVDILENDVTIGNDITVLNFSNEFDINLDSQSRVSIALASPGTGSVYTLSGVYNEDISGQMPGTAFTTANVFAPNSLIVHLDGLRKSDYTEDSDYNSFTTNTTYNGTTLIVDYEVLVSGQSHFHSDYVTYPYLFSGYYNASQIITLLAAYSPLSHTHLEADILDLVHDADFIGGIPVLSGISPVDDSVISYDSTLAGFLTRNIEVNQQFIFTVDGAIDTTIEGVKPLRIYAHDVNSGATLTEILAFVATAPVTTALQLAVRKNGATLINSPGYFTINTGVNSISITSFVSSTFTKDDYFQLQIVQGDDGGASDLTVHIRFSYNL